MPISATKIASAARKPATVSDCPGVDSSNALRPAPGAG
jgi:hypothetical protein